MASLSLTHPLVMTTTPSAPTIRIPFPTKPNQPGFVRRIACKASDQGSNKKNPSKLDRRDMLIGLGGLYGVAGLTLDPLASATGPVQAPDLSKCHNLLDPPSEKLKDVKCCPPYSDKIVDFRPCQPPRTLRIRPAAQWMDPDDVAKYKKALALMKALPEDDPRSFVQQAKVHCAYCNGAYDQVNSGNDHYIQVHHSWLFFPFHRWYLYFYEKILGSLIDDPSFALPFWNWDHPSGYQIPSIFVDQTSPLYDLNRNPCHLPPTMVDLDYTAGEIFNPKPPVSEAQQVSINLSVMYRQMVSSAKIPLLFFGEPYKNGDCPDPGQGSIESMPHNTIHIWCGDNRRENWEDMGSFHSSGRDPLFYSHHANVDRMWNIWKSIPGAKRVDINDQDYLNSTFLFYDENAQLVRVRVGDSLDSKKLGYVYQEVDLPWLRSKPRPTKINQQKMLTKKTNNSGSLPVKDPPPNNEDMNITPISRFPLTLSETVTIVVKRPQKSRSRYEKEFKEEVLVVSGIHYNIDEPVKFDIYINDEDDDAITGPQKAEFAGSFSTVVHKSKVGVQSCDQMKLNIGISDLLEDIGADDDDSVKVTLVPRSGIGKVTIEAIKIDYIA
ncbi:hypothetical protein CsatB_012251 [Cannabis sativa]